MPSRRARLDARAGHDQQAVLGVVRVVRARVVLERVDALVAADGADGAPERSPKRTIRSGATPFTSS